MGDKQHADNRGPRLTPAEDAELRQLTWFAKAGHLPHASQARLAELRSRDRRSRVRDPRPDPSSKSSTTPETRFTAEPVTPAICSNCGFALIKSGPASAICSNCGFAARQDRPRVDNGLTKSRPDESSTAPQPPRMAAAVPAPALFGAVDGPTYRALLATAALGGAHPAGAPALMVADGQDN